MSGKWSGTNGISIAASCPLGIRFRDRRVARKIVLARISEIQRKTVFSGHGKTTAFINSTVGVGAYTRF